VTVKREHVSGNGIKIFYKHKKDEVGSKPGKKAERRKE
jgi:hypothetical protein